jgi:polysaccharide export outer membrane protein
VLGTIRVEGMTRRDLVEMLTERIALDVKDPIVNISFANFRVTVLGEVRAPGTFTMVSDRTTIFQALSMAGDLGLTARRGNVLLVRETTDGYQYVRLDLRRSDLLTSPWYYMSQNDLLYVAPSRGRIQSGTASTTVLSIISSALSLVSVGVALYLLL